MSYFRKINIPKEILLPKGMNSGSGSILARKRKAKEELEDGINDYFYVQDAFNKEFKKISTEFKSKTDSLLTI